MMLMTWHRALAQRAKTFRRGFVLKRRRRSSFRPMVEALEDRLVLSTFLVTSNLDDSSGSTLRDAIVAVNAGLDDTIAFNISGSNIIAVGANAPNLGQALPALTKPVTIDGNNQAGGQIVLDGSSLSFGYGLTLSFGSSNSVIQGLDIENFPYFAIFIQSSNNSITNNTLTMNGTSGFGGGVQIETDNNSILDNTIIFNGRSQGFADGVLIENGSFNTVSGNTIAHNDTHGVEIDDGFTFANSISGATGFNQVLNNLISGNGTSGFGDGVLIHTSSPASFNRVSGNTIESNASDGVQIVFDDNNMVSGNTIVTNGQNGVEIDDGSPFSGGPTGGSNKVANNTISGNGTSGSGDGVLILNETFSPGSDNRVTGNFIDSNTGNGVNIISDDNNSVTGNTIDNNGSAGVAVGFLPLSSGSQSPPVLDTFARGNVILGNSIFNNGTLGIDLNSDGVPTPTDPNADPVFLSGPNDLLPYPQLLSATNDGVTATVSGIVHSFPLSTLTLEFFANVVADPSGFGEGQIPLGTMDVTTDVLGDASFTFSFGPVAGANFITATATLQAPSVTGLKGAFASLSLSLPGQPFETSEFSNAIPLPPPPPTIPGDTTTVTILSKNFVPPIPPVIPPLPVAQSIAVVIQGPSDDPIQLVSQFFSRQPLVESPGEIHGRIWEDPNASGKKGGDNFPLEGQVVFIDANHNGVFDDGERFTVTNAKGEYSFTGLPAGTYTVLPLLERGQDMTFSLARENRVELRSGAMVVDNVDIGIRQRAMRRRRLADALRDPGMERALAIALANEGLEGLNGPEGPLAVPEEALPARPLVAAIAPTPAAEDEPTHQPPWWQTLLVGALIAPWCLLNVLQWSAEPEAPDNE
jgi:parallel beta-helix repeat protein